MLILTLCGSDIASSFLLGLGTGDWLAAQELGSLGGEGTHGLCKTLRWAPLLTSTLLTQDLPCGI